MGDFFTDPGELISSSTDNSLYQKFPAAVVYPRYTSDVQLLLKVLSQENYPDISVTARGGLTGTNGQSLQSGGIIIDFSRHMHSVRDIQREEQWVWVEPGVILNELNSVLNPLGLFFPIDISSGSRATLGGMIATDASGKCSTCYGKTLSYLLELEWVDTEGRLHRSHPQPELCSAEDHALIDSLQSLAPQFEEFITQLWPKSERYLTGYNLRDAFRQSQINLLALLCGSEGTLGIITGAKLKLLHKKPYRGLALVAYSTFSHALNHAVEIRSTHPDAIETLDAHLVKKVLETPAGDLLKKYLDQPYSLNLIEWNAQQNSDIHRNLEQAYTLYRSNAPQKGIVNITCFDQETVIQTFWDMRKKAVNIAASLSKNYRAAAFIEDTVVPVDRLEPYYQDLKSLLESAGLSFVVFGHLDAGCLHVRPMLDLGDAQTPQIVSELTEQVAQLTKSYGGLLWGEHGKGFRSSYNPLFFGSLYTCLRQIKTLFDPFNKLNPGKIALPLAAQEDLASVLPLERCDEARQIDPSWKEIIDPIIQCDGNGFCHQTDTAQTLCPSYQATLNRSLSPKGRSDLARSWALWQSHHSKTVKTLRLFEPTRFNHFKHIFSSISHKLVIKFRSTKNHGPNLSTYNTPAFPYPTEALRNSLNACLGCQACSFHCPVKTNISEFKSRFLFQYYQDYFRPLRDYLLVYMEGMLLHSLRLYRILYKLAQIPALEHFCFRTLQISHLPEPAPSDSAYLWKKMALPNAPSLSQLTPKHVGIYIDAFHFAFEPQIILSWVQLLRKQGYIPFKLPYFTSGKMLYTLGMLESARWLSQNITIQILPYLEAGIPLVCLEPSLALYFREEVVKMNPELTSFTRPFLLPWEFMNEYPWSSNSAMPSQGTKGPSTRANNSALQNNSSLQKSLEATENLDSTPNYQLFLHCAESTAMAEAKEIWPAIFRKQGLNLKIAQVGCCGMAGAFGHLSENQELSHKVFELSWQKALLQQPIHNLATGYSCRTQAERFAHKRLPHPLEILAQSC